MARIDPDAPFAGLVDHIQGQYGFGDDLQYLQNQIQIAFQPRGIGYNKRHIRFVENQKITRHLFVFRGGHQGIGAGQIHHFVHFVAVAEITFLAFDGFSGPIAGMLMQTGQAVEKRTFARIGITGQSHQIIIFAPGVAQGREPFDAMKHTMAAPRMSQ